MYYKNYWHVSSKELLVISKYMIENKTTFREMERLLGIPKSTLHSMIHRRLPKISPIVYEQLKSILNINYNSKYIRGGQSTKKRFEQMHL